MDKDSGVNNQYSEIKITDRKRISISGVKKIVSFNPEEFLIETTLGVLLLKGSQLEIIKLDTQVGNLSIKGKFDNINYMDATKKGDTSFISRLFK